MPPEPPKQTPAIDSGSTSAPCYQDVVEELRSWLEVEIGTFTDCVREVEQKGDHENALKWRDEQFQLRRVRQWLKNRLPSEPSTES